MGQAKLRRQRFRSDQPVCVYCGGSVPATSRDHCPPIAIFDGRRRPAGLEFGACHDCHQATRPLDSIAAVLSRLFPTPTTDEQRADVRNHLTGLANNHPEIAAIFAAPDELVWWEGRLANVVHIEQADKLHKAMNAFAARMCLALYREVTGRAAPANAAIVSRWYSNYEVANGELPLDFATSLGSTRTLQMGKQHAFDQFKWAAAATSDSPHGFGYVATFRRSFAVSGAMWTNSTVEEYPEAYRPGFLKNFVL